MICKYCRKKINILEAYNQACKELAEKKGLAFHTYEHVPCGVELQCTCGAVNKVVENV